MNDNQNELFNELKRIYTWQHSHFSDILYHLANRDLDMFDKETIAIYDLLNETDYVIVINEFSKWILNAKFVTKENLLIKLKRNIEETKFIVNTIRESENKKEIQNELTNLENLYNEIKISSKKIYERQ